MTGPSPPRRVPTLTEVVAWPPAGATASGTPAAASQNDTVAQGVAASLVRGPAPAPIPVAAPAQALPFALAPTPAPAPVAAPAQALLSPIDEDQLVQRVLAGLQRQVDLMLDYRLREALSPVLARAADAIVREARVDIATSVRDLVERAVAQELARLRTR